ncbi:MAG: Fic family protein [Maritimibacter sp.]|nr:Fic family protein [Maritimibacter sp.]
MSDKNTYDLSEAVDYHYGKFPPEHLDLQVILEPLTEATASLARYDQMLGSMLNSEILLAPLRTRDAVVSSRMEGTISTIDEVMQLEAAAQSGDTDAHRTARNETIEVALYARALRQSQQALSEGRPISEHLLRSAHQTLLAFGRGASKHPGSYKTEQNYVGDRGTRRVRIIPINPQSLPGGMEALVAYINSNDQVPLVRTALAHVEFEALHPFEDGNGRVGRMLITLMLWKLGLISQPHFYVSGYFEQYKDEYVERMRAVSAEGDWTGWTVFFLRALNAQALENLSTAGEIQRLYDVMRERFREILHSQWSNHALDFVFANPYFRNNLFTRDSGIPAPTANRFTRLLVDNDLLRTIIPAAGRRPAMYAFEPLLEVVRGD